jgi:hypothetical protein
MIESTIKAGGYQNWEDVPVSTQDEVLAPQAVLQFSAKTTLSEKIQRVFNDLMFLIVGAKILTLIPAVGAASTSLSGMGFAFISGTSVMQIPAVVAILAVAPKIILTLALIVVIRKVLAVAICHIVYIAVLASRNKEEIDNERWEQFERLTEQQFECRRIALNKSGINYDAFVIEHEETKGNGQWVLIAGGNGWIGERALEQCTEGFKQQGFNIVFVNGPGVARSTGFPTSYSIGAGQESGLQFLEKAIQAKKIFMYGTSLGAGAQSEAILSHEFKTEDFDYIVQSDRSFDLLSNAASNMVTILAKPLFFLLGIELNGVAGARKLEDLGITHIVTQNSQGIEKNGSLSLDNDINDQGTDGVIPNIASLVVGLQKAGVQDSERLKIYAGPRIWHNGDLPYDVERLVQADLQDFLVKV